MAQPCEILIPDDTFNQVQGQGLVTVYDLIRLKGKTTSCKVYRLDGLQKEAAELARQLACSRTDEDG